MDVSRDSSAMANLKLAAVFRLIGLKLLYFASVK